MSFLGFILMLLAGLILTAFFTLLERQLLGLGQVRLGPRKVGPYGLLQPIRDAIKLIVKQVFIPYKARTVGFMGSPVLAMILAVIGWSLQPCIGHYLDLSYGLLGILILSSLTVYPILIGGWFSNSKWAGLGAIRAVAQTISYEVRITFVILSVVVYVCTLSLDTFFSSNIWLLFILSVNLCLWLITLLAETSRAPFDLPEGERELVSGYNTEYRGGAFAIIFIAEYLSILVLCYVTILLFTGWAINVIILAIVCIVLLARLSLPRARVDWLITLTWSHLLPASMVLLFLSAAISGYSGYHYRLI